MAVEDIAARGQMATARGREDCFRAGNCDTIGVLAMVFLSFLLWDGVGTTYSRTERKPGENFEKRNRWFSGYVRGRFGWGGTQWLRNGGSWHQAVGLCRG
jgi:hypothetical protein